MNEPFAPNPKLCMQIYWDSDDEIDLVIMIITIDDFVTLIDGCNWIS